MHIFWGGVPEVYSRTEPKFLFTRADPGVTKEFAPRQTSRGGGLLWKIKFLVTRADPGVTKENV